MAGKFLLVEDFYAAMLYVVSPFLSLYIYIIPLGRHVLPFTDFSSMVLFAKIYQYNFITVIVGCAFD